MKKSIYGDRSQEVADCFVRAGGPEKVLIVAMDLAKSEHSALLCLGTGEYLVRQPLRVYNNPDGVKYLVEKIEAVRAKYRIAKGNVLIGGEDPGPYTFNFIHGLSGHGLPFVRVNSAEASTLRQNRRASSDSIDPDGIAQMIALQRGRAMAGFDEIYWPLKCAARNRRHLVRQETAWKNRIHRSIEILFPGFLCRDETPILPFTTASLNLMADDFSVIKVKRMRLETLVRHLHADGTQEPERAAAELKALADRVLPPPPEVVPYESANLARRVQMLRAVQDCLAMEETEMARCLVQTPGFYLTTIPGIGVVLAGHIMAEYGPPSAWRSAADMVSYPGIVPRQKASGGLDQPPTVGHLPMDANRILKDYLLQAAHHAGTTGEHRLQQHYQQVENRQGKSRLSTAKLLVRIGRQMVLTETPYLPLTLLRPQLPPPPEYTLAYFVEVSNRLLAKWKPYYLAGLPRENNYWLKWQEDLDRVAEFVKNSK